MLSFEIIGTSSRQLLCGEKAFLQWDDGTLACLGERSHGDDGEARERRFIGGWSVALVQQDWGLRGDQLYGFAELFPEEE